VPNHKIIIYSFPECGISVAEDASEDETINFEGVEDQKVGSSDDKIVAIAHLTKVIVEKKMKKKAMEETMMKKVIIKKVMKKPTEKVMVK